MSEPELIIVNGVPVKSETDIALRWTCTLFFAHLIYFIYQYNITDEHNSMLSLTFSFLMCGIYLPFYGYITVKKNKRSAMRFFTVLLTLISSIGIVSALSYISFYYELAGICNDCEVIFKNGTQDCNISFVRNEVIYITADECSKMPSENIFVAQHALELFVNIIGMITACVITGKRQHAHVSETVPALASINTPVSIITISGEQVVACTEDVPEIITV